MARGLNIFVNIGAKLLPSLNATASGVERRMQTMTRRMRVMAAEAKASWVGTQRSLSGFGTHVSMPMAAFTAIGARSAYEWSKVGNELQAVSQMGDRARKSIEGIARAMPGDSTKNLSMALDLARTGFSAKAIEASLGTTLKLSRADNSLSPADTADMMTNVMTGMGLHNDQMSAAQIEAVAKRVANNLAIGAAQSSSDLRLMGESFKYAAPLASRLGIEIEDLTAYFMTMADAGIKGSESGVALRSGMVRLLKPTNAAMAVLERLNLKIDDYVTSTSRPTGDAIIKSLRLQGIAADGVRGQIDALLKDKSLSGGQLIQKISEAVGQGIGEGADAADLDKISDGVAQALIAGASRVDFGKFLADFRKKGGTTGDLVNFFDVRQGARLATLTDGSFERNRQQVQSALKVAAGQGDFLDKMYAQQMKGAVGPWERMQQSFSNLIIAMAESGAMDTVAGAMDSIASAMMSLSKTNPGILKAITLAIIGLAAIAPIGFALTGVGLGLRALWIGAKVAFFPVRALWRLLFSPVAKAGPRMPWLQRFGPSIMKHLGFIWKGMKIVGSALWRALGTAVRAGLSRLGPMLVSGLRMALPWLLRGIALLFTPVGWIAAIVGLGALLIWAFWDDIKAAWPKLVNWFTSSAWPAVKRANIDAYRWGGEVIDKLLGGMQSKWASVKSWWTQKWQELSPPAWVLAALPGGAPLAAAKIAAGPKVAGKRAGGGPVLGGRTYLVGERGPELFQAPFSGRIIPHLKTAAMLGAAAGWSLPAAAAAPLPAAAPAEIAREQSRGPAPAADAGDTLNLGGVTFNIKGMNPREIAQEVERVLKKLAARNSALLSD